MQFLYLAYKIFLQMFLYLQSIIPAGKNLFKVHSKNIRTTQFLSAGKSIIRYSKHSRNIELIDIKIYLRKIS